MTAGLGALATFAGAIKDLPAFAQAAVTGAAGSALTQGIAVATGLQGSFSWREVAISAVAAPVAQSAGKLAAGIPGIGGFASNFASGVAGSYVRRAFGGKIDTATILADAFGNALGNSIVDRITPRQAATAASEAGASSDELQEVQVTANYILNEVAVTAQRLEANPDNSIVNPAFALTPDEQRSVGSQQVQVATLRRSDPLRGSKRWLSADRA